MLINKDIVMQKVQRFGGAMFTPVLLFTFFGIMAALSILFKNTAIMIFGLLSKKVPGLYFHNYHFYL